MTKIPLETISLFLLSYTSHFFATAFLYATYNNTKVIHSADPQSWQVVIIVFAHIAHPSVPSFQNLAKQNKFQVKTMFTTGETVGLAEWIIDDTCLVLH